MKIYFLEAECEVVRPVNFRDFRNANYIRGAWYDYLVGEVLPADHPIIQNQSQVRPYALRFIPPRDNNHTKTYFGLTLFGESLVPYAINSLAGFSARVGKSRDGQIEVTSIYEKKLVRSFARVLFDKSSWTVTPAITGVTLDEIRHFAANYIVPNIKRNNMEFQVRFLTPTHMKHKGVPMTRETLDYKAMLYLIMTRWNNLASLYGDESDIIPEEEFDRVLPAATNGLTEVGRSENKDKPEWCVVRGYSSRSKRPTYMDGILGTVNLKADSPETLETVIPYLFLGQLIQVGNNTAKGNGVYNLYWSY